MNSEWCNQASLAIERLPEDAGVSYHDAEALAHYRRVHATLAARTQVEALAQAGFLHGVPTGFLPHLRKSGVEISTLAERLLVDRERLREVDHTPFASGTRRRDDPQMLRAVFGRVTSHVSAVLFVLEQIDHLDPDGTGRAWLQRCYRDVQSAGPPPPLVPLIVGKGTPASHLAFIDTIVGFVTGHLGFSRERRLVRDLVLMHREPEAVQRIVELLAEQRQQMEAIRESAERMMRREGSGVGSITWEWRHLRSCQEELGPEATNWPQRIGRCGFVTVETAGTTVCYALLEMLHRTSRASNGSIRDYISAPTPSGYRALHTAIDWAHEQGLIPVMFRIIESAANNARLADQLVEVAQGNRRPAIQVPTEDSITVYTPSHDVKVLPAGSSVLHFACLLHRRWIARIDHALINEYGVVGSFYQLKHGDRVRLVLKPTPEFLEEHWLTKLHPDRREGLREQYAAAIRPLIISAGHQRIRRALDSANGHGVPDHIIETLVHTAMARGLSSRWLSRPYAAKQWLFQLGLLTLRADNSGFDIPGRLEIDAELAQKAMDVIVEAAEPIAELDIPPDIQRHVSTIVNCGICRPIYNRPVLGVVLDNLLTIHATGCPEASAGKPIPIHRRNAYRQYVTIGTSNRSGLLADLGDIFRRKNVDIVEVIGRRHSPRWGAIRFELDCASGNVPDDLLNEIRAVPAVEKVLGPRTQPDAMLERDMPPRRDGLLTTFGVNPIVRSVPVTRDDQFYGRDEELKEFKSNVQALFSPDERLGRMLWLTGPLQSGKTSFIFRALRELHRVDNRLCVEIYLEAHQGESWNAFQQRFMKSLVHKIAMLAEQWGRSMPDIPTGDFHGAVCAVKEWTGDGAVVVVIDEVERLIEATSKQDDEECDEMSRVTVACRATPGVMMVWIGPPPRIRPRTNRRYLELGRLLGEKAQFFTLSAFREEEIDALLAARKSIWASRIAVDRRIVSEVSRLTSGDPLTVGCLVHRLWEMALAPGATPMARSTEATHLEAAARNLIERDRCFDIRMRFLKSTAGTVVREAAYGALRHLSHEEAGSTADGLAEHASTSLETLLDTLEVLDSAGLIRGLNGTGQDRHYQIASPLLSRYFRENRHAFD